MFWNDEDWYRIFRVRQRILRFRKISAIPFPPSELRRQQQAPTTNRSHKLEELETAATASTVGGELLAHTSTARRLLTTMISWRFRYLFPFVLHLLFSHHVDSSFSDTRLSQRYRCVINVNFTNSISSHSTFTTTPRVSGSSGRQLWQGRAVSGCVAPAPPPNRMQACPLRCRAPAAPSDPPLPRCSTLPSLPDACPPPCGI